MFDAFRVARPVRHADQCRAADLPRPPPDTVTLEHAFDSQQVAVCEAENSDAGVLGLWEDHKSVAGVAGVLYSPSGGGESGTRSPQSLVAPRTARRLTGRTHAALWLIRTEHRLTPLFRHHRQPIPWSECCWPSRLSGNQTVPQATAPPAGVVAWTSVWSRNPATTSSVAATAVAKARGLMR